MNDNLAEKVLCQTRVTAEMLKRREAREKQASAEQTAVAGAIPDAVQALLDNDRIEGHQKEAVANGLTSHVACIELITKLACHRNAAEMATIGTPAGGNGATPASEKQASYAGAPVTSWDDTEAGQRFKDILFSGGQRQP
jgi:hypothetical protein